jgi:predicted metal-dependent peptidase
MNKKADVQKAVMRGIVDLIRAKPLYGHVLQQLHKVFLTGDPANADPRMPTTMAVGKQPGEMLVKLYVHEAFVQEIWDKAKDENQACDQVMTVLEHEVLHLIFNHLELEFSDRLRGNVAIDLVCNSLLNQNNLPGEPCLPAKYGFEPNQSAMWYYTHLKDNKEFQNQCKNGNFGVPGLSEAAKNGHLGGMRGSHSMWGEMLKDPVMREMVKDLVRKSKELCDKNYGDVPGQVIQQIEDLFDRKASIVPWNRVLRMFAASAAESNLDYTMKRLSRRFGTRPGTRKEDVLNLAVAVDTSGSVDDNLLALFFNEIKWIWKNGAKITVYEADAQIQREYQFKGKFTGEVAGRGGTDLEPVLKEVEGKYDALIYFTDFYAPQIKHRYNIPILWVLKTDMDKSQFPYEWGKHVKIEDMNAVPA